MSTGAWRVFIFILFIYFSLLPPPPTPPRPPAVSRPSKLQFNRTLANRIHGPTDGRTRTYGRTPSATRFCFFYYYSVIYDTATRSDGPAASETFRNMANVLFFLFIFLSLREKFRTVRPSLSSTVTRTETSGESDDDSTTGKIDFEHARESPSDEILRKRLIFVLH